MAEQPDETYSDEEAARRRDKVIKRMLNTQPQPRRPKRETKSVKGKPARKARSKSPS